MRNLYYPAQQGKQAELCRTLTAAILDHIRDPETRKLREEYRLGFMTSALRSAGITIPSGAMNTLETRGWIMRSPAVPRSKARAGVWVVTPEAVRFLDERRVSISPAAGEVLA